MHTADGDFAVFQRLTQHLQCIPGKFRQLVQEQNPVVGQADFAGAGIGAAAHYGGGADAVVGTAEGAFPDQSVPPRRRPATE